MSVKKLLGILFFILLLPVLASAQITISGCTSCTNGVSILLGGDVQVQGTLKQGPNSTVQTGFLTGSATLDFASAAATVCSADLTITVTGAVAGNACALAVPNASVNAGSQFTCWVSAANTVTVRHCNISAAPNDPASAVFKVAIFQF